MQPQPNDNAIPLSLPGPVATYLAAVKAKNADMLALCFADDAGLSRQHMALERDGKMQVVLPYSRTRKVAVMTFRSEADLQALMAQTKQH